MRVIVLLTTACDRCVACHNCVYNNITGILQKKPTEFQFTFHLQIPVTQRPALSQRDVQTCCDPLYTVTLAHTHKSLLDKS